MTENIRLKRPGWIAPRGIKVLLLVLPLTFYSHINLGQTSSAPITVQWIDQPLIQVLEYLQQDLKAPIVYAPDILPSSLNISIAMDHGTLKELIQLVCQHPQLTCEYVEDFYIIKSASLHPLAEMTRKDGHTKPDSGMADLSAPLPQTMHTSSVLIIKQADPAAFTFPSGTMDHKDFQIPKIYPYKFLERSRIQSRSWFSGGLSYRMDWYEFHFRPGMLTEQKYTAAYNQGIVAELYFNFSQGKLWLNTGMGYTTKNFNYAYHFRALDINDPIAIPDITSVQLGFLEFPLRIGYRLVKAGHLYTFGTLGIVGGIPVSKEERTSYLNNEIKATDIYSPSTASFISGVTAGLQLTFPFHHHWKLTFSPQLIQYFQAVNSAAMDSPAQLFNIRAGILYN